MGVVFKLLRVSIWDAVMDIGRCNTATSFSFGVLSPSGELQTKKVEPINCIKKCNLSTPLGPSLMPLHQWFFIFIWSFWHDYPNRLNCGSSLVLRSFNTRRPVSSYIMQQNLFCVKRVEEIWGAELFPHLIVVNKIRPRAKMARTIRKAAIVACQSRFDSGYIQLSNAKETLKEFK